LLCHFAFLFLLFALIFEGLHMLDTRLIREKPELVRQALEKRGDSFALDSIVEIDSRYRSLLRQTEELRAKHNEASKELSKSPEKPPQLIAQMRQLGEQISSLQQQTKEAKASLDSLLLELPNIPHPSVPLGRGADDNVVARTWGKPREFPFKPLPHWELGEKLGIIDFQQGVKLSGTRFYVLKGLGAHLQRALISFMLNVHVNEHGYKEIYPPFMVKRECMVGSGNLPKFGDNLYHDEEDDFWFIPTAEVPLTNLHRDEILSADSLPLCYVAYTPCFRREKMAAGTDTRGIKRGHQFDKVELYKVTRPESSNEQLEKLVADAEDICRRLDIPYRVVQLCTGDLGFAACKTYDIEMWAPGCAEWLEVSSCSNCSDFQARRANIRYRPEPGAKSEFVHTLNGSGLALPRVLIAVLENYQQADGTVLIPEVLEPYLKVT
jgi:seryl-tRNA synthetase